MKAVKAIKFDHTMSGSNHAWSNLQTHIIYLNPHTWPGLSDSERYFVLKHEEGHLAHQSKSEILADQYAAQKFFEKGYSLQELATIIQRLVPPGKKNQPQRVRRMLKRALFMDFAYNRNQQAFEQLRQL